MKDQQRFKAEIQKGHKGEAVVVPFNPARVWDAKAVEVPPPCRLGYLVAGTLNGCPFEGWIGFRWGRFFMLVPEELRGAAGVSIGDEVQVVVGPRGTTGAAGTGPGRAGRLGPARSKRTLPELPTKNPTPSTTRTRR
jgi:hypothetical protein